MRQTETLRDGGRVIQETRLWDPDRNRSTSMRGKEEAHDYRYFPDPDLLPLTISTEWIERVRQELPELPEAKRDRFVEDYGLPAYDADLLTTDRELADYFETCLETFNNPKPVSNWIMGPLLGVLNTAGKSIDASPVSPENLGRLLQLIEEGVISGKIAKTVFDEMAVSGHAPDRIVKERGLVQVSDAGPNRGRRRQGHGRKCRRSAGLQGRQNQTARLFRGPGDAGNQGEGQSPGGE